MSRRIHGVVRIERQMQASSRISRAAAAAVILIALGLAACEREEPELSGPVAEAEEEAEAQVPGGADPAAVEVIDSWARTLARGDVKGAARLFAVPSVAENGPVSTRIRSAADARRFNASLPCGARLVEASEQGAFIVATFELIERPGPGSCGSGTGETAQTAFEIEGRKIVEWRRVLADEAGAPGNPV
jgi:hypothetical protein